MVKYFESKFSTYDTIKHHQHDISLTVEAVGDQVNININPIVLQMYAIFVNILYCNNLY